MPVYRAGGERKVQVGDIVHWYQLSERTGDLLGPYAAMVVGVGTKNRTDLTIYGFAQRDRFIAEENFHVMRLADIPFSPTPQPDTWTWRP